MRHRGGGVDQGKVFSRCREVIHVIDRHAAPEVRRPVPPHVELVIGLVLHINVDRHHPARRLQQVAGQGRGLNKPVPPRRQQAGVGERIAHSEIDAGARVEHRAGHIVEGVGTPTQIDVARRGQGTVVDNGFVADAALDIVGAAGDRHGIVDGEPVGRAIHKPHPRGLGAVDGASVQRDRDIAGLAPGNGSCQDPCGVHARGPDVAGLRDRDIAGRARVGNGSGLDPFGLLALGGDIAGLRDRDIAGRASGGIGPCPETVGDPALGGDIAVLRHRDRAGRTLGRTGIYIDPVGVVALGGHVAGLRHRDRAGQARVGKG